MIRFAILLLRPREAFSILQTRAESRAGRRFRKFGRFAIASAFLFTGDAALADEGGWWPEQAAPAEVVSVPQPSGPAERILLEGLVGLWARAVNEGRGDSLVWVERPVHYPDWKAETLQRLNASTRTLPDVGALLDETIQRGYLEGFVLYRLGAPGEEPLDHSVNVATMLAGVLDAAIVEESLVDGMSGRGLSELADARTLDYDEVRARYAGQFDPDLLFLISPGNDGRVERMRDLVVAHRARISYGVDDTTAAAMLDTPIPGTAFGWNEGGEFGHIGQASRLGLINTVSDWLSNVSVLSAGAREYEVPPVPTFNPAGIDWADERFPVSFLMSDGDNTGWVARGFWGDPNGNRDGDFWDHPEHGDFPVGFTAATSDLVDFAPVVIDRLAETKPEDTSVVHFSGYYYPDLFAADREGREAALRKLARTKARQMEKTGAIILTFIAENTASPATQEAMRIFAEEIRPLLGMMVIDYSPYNAQQGRIFWIDDGDGGQVPAVTPRYALWHELGAPNSGSPEEVAGFMNRDHDRFDAAWATVHAWSDFPRPGVSGSDQGVPAVGRAVEAVDSDKVNVVSPEEMLWRLRAARNRHDVERLNEEIHRLSPGSSPRLGEIETLFHSDFQPADESDYAPENRPSGWGGDGNSAYPVRRWSFDENRAPAGGDAYFAEVLREPGDTDNVWEMSSRFPTAGSSRYAVTFDFKAGTDPEINEGETEGRIDFVYRNWDPEGGYLGPDLNLALHNDTGSIGEAGFDGSHDFASVSIGEPDSRGWRTVTVNGTTTNPEAESFDLWFVGRDNFAGSFGIDNVTVLDGLEGISRLDSWRLHHFDVLENSEDAADSADPDGDGLKNLIEYALGTDPSVPHGNPSVSLGKQNGSLTLRFRHIDDPDLTYSVEAAHQLPDDWETARTYPAFTRTGTETYTEIAPVADAPRRFLRLSVSLAD